MFIRELSNLFFHHFRTNVENAESHGLRNVCGIYRADTETPNIVAIILKLK